MKYCHYFASKASPIAIQIIKERHLDQKTIPKLENEEGAFSCVFQPFSDKYLYKGIVYEYLDDSSEDGAIYKLAKFDMRGMVSILSTYVDSIHVPLVVLVSTMAFVKNFGRRQSKTSSKILHK